jgi:hypothetical protein
MVLPAIFLLFGDELRNWLRTSGEGIFKNRTGEEALAFIREFGIRIRTQDFYAIRREVLDLTKYQEQLGAINENVLIPLHYTDTTHGLNISENFLYRFNVTGTTTSTGEAFERRYAVASMYQLSKADAADLLTDMLSNAERESAMTIDSMELDSSLGKPGLW